MKKVIISSLVLLGIAVSCTNSDRDISERIDTNNTNTSKKQKFDYSIYNNRDRLFNVLSDKGLSKYSKSIDKDKLFLQKLNSLNKEFQTNLEISEVDRYLISNRNANAKDLLDNGYITQEEYDILNIFADKKQNNSFEESIKYVQEYIILQNFSNEKFEKYNNIVNGLMIINSYYENKGIDIFGIVNTNGGYQTYGGGMSAGCAWALAANMVSSLGLTSCVVPGPNCAVAAVGKAMSLIEIYYSCA